MNVCELRKLLKSGESSESWVTAISHFFKSYELNYGHGTENSLDEAYWLLRAQQGWEPESWLQAQNPDMIDSIVELAGRRVTERRPLAYLLGEAWFAGLCFNVDERVLIPRSPLAEVIERGLRPWCWLEATDRALDIGTGSACLAVAIAHYCPGVSVDANEAMAEALRREHGQTDKRVLALRGHGNELRARHLRNVELVVLHHTIEDFARRFDLNVIKIDAIDFNGAVS